MLPKLDVLDVFFNKIETLDVELTKLTSLRALDLGSNDIVTVPPQLGLMTSLRYTPLLHPRRPHVHSNLITISLSSSWIRSLNLEGNRIRAIRPAILQQGTSSLLEYLRNRIPTTTTN